MFPVELLRGEGAHTVEVLVLVSVLPADGVRRAAEANADNAEHLNRKHERQLSATTSNGRRAAVKTPG